jgi:hypothetical protein
MAGLARASRHLTDMQRVSLLALRLREGRFAFTTSLGTHIASDSCESAPGPDDPSTPPWLGVSGRWRQLIAAALPLAPQRLYGFYDREPAAGCAANFMSGLCLTAFGLTTKINHAQSLFYPQRYPQQIGR